MGQFACAELLEHVLLRDECALLISVDRDLLDMRTFQGIPIVRPGEYWLRVRDVN